MSYLFIKKSVSKRNLYYFHKKLKSKKNPKKTSGFSGFFRCFFLGFFWVCFLLPTLEKGRIGDEEVWTWQGQDVVEAGSRGTLRLRLYLCSRSLGVCSVKRVRHEIEFVERKEKEEAEIDLGLLF
jgi:hypothetical protein